MDLHPYQKRKDAQIHVYAFLSVERGELDTNYASCPPLGICPILAPVAISGLYLRWVR